MEVPLQITYRDDVLSAATIDALIHEESDRLERFFPRIVSCHVIVERAYHDPHAETPFQTRVEILVPGEQIAIKSDPHRDVAMTVRDAFRRAKRRIQDYSRQIRGDVKHHETRVPRTSSSRETQ